MLATQRTNLVSRALDTLATFYPASLVFPGFADPIPARRRIQSQNPVLGLGFSATAPAVFLVLKVDFPDGLTVTPQFTTFTADGVLYRIEEFTSEPADPHVRLACNLAAR
jgi:hypothetical protein